MCGLVGIAGDIDHETRTKIFKDFLDTCASRGRDSTGVIRVKKGGDYSFAKQVGAPAYLYDSRQWDRHIEGEAQALIGHCRSKTIGDATIRNAHPFDFPEKGIIGVHNGTLRGYYNLDTHHHSKVDSEVLYGHLAENGPAETFNKVEGAYACVWWDNEAGTLNFIRNNERPLWLTWSKDYRTMYWASEIWMFGAITRRKQLWDGGEKKEIYHELPINTLWSFRINCAAGKDEKVMSLRPVTEIKLEKKPLPPYPYHGSNGMAFHNNRGPGKWVKGVWTPDAPVGKRWEEVSPGVHRRVFELPVLPNPAKGKGGEVTNPFVVKDARPLVTVIDGDQLNDLLELKAQRDARLGNTLEDSTSLPLSSVEFLRNSVQSSDSQTPPNSTKDSKKNILSLPEKPSNIFPMADRGKFLKPCGTSSLSSSLRRKEGVSFRTVAGVPYITWNANGREFTEQALMHNTGGCCNFCKKTLLGIDEVADFITEQRVICTDCLIEPSMLAPQYDVC